LLNVEFTKKVGARCNGRSHSSNTINTTIAISTSIIIDAIIDTTITIAIITISTTIHINTTIHTNIVVTIENINSIKTNTYNDAIVTIVLIAIIVIVIGNSTRLCTSGLSLFTINFGQFSSTTTSE
jgi:hypothetical protein